MANLQIGTHTEYDPLRQFDRVVILTGGIRRNETGQYASTRYEDGDANGMLGGRMRILAGATLLVAGVCEDFVFSGGKSIKQAQDFDTEDFPDAASVYAAEFNETLHAMQNSHHVPTVRLENESPNTIASVQALQDLGLITPDTGVLTSDYHVERSRMLFRRAGFELPFLSAEQIVMRHMPGVHDNDILQAYRSESGLLRLQRETQGVHDLLHGLYDSSEQTLVK